MRQLRVQGTNRRNTITAEEAPIYYVREIVTVNYRKTIPKIISDKNKFQLDTDFTRKFIDIKRGLYLIRHF